MQEGLTSALEEAGTASRAHQNPPFSFIIKRGNKGTL